MSEWNVKQIADTLVLIQVEIIILLTGWWTKPEQWRENYKHTLNTE